MLVGLFTIGHVSGKIQTRLNSLYQSCFQMGIYRNRNQFINCNIFVTQEPMQNFGILGQLLKIPPLSAQKCHSAGGRGVPKFLFVRSPCIISERYDNPIWDFRYGTKEKESGIIPKIVAYLSLLRWSHALHSDQNTLYKFIS